MELLELLDDPERRARMGEFGRNRVVNELEWQYEAPKLLAAYAYTLQFPVGAGLPAKNSGKRAIVGKVLPTYGQLCVTIGARKRYGGIF